MLGTHSRERDSNRKERIMPKELMDYSKSAEKLVNPPEVKVLLDKMHEAGINEEAIIGEVVAEPKGRIIVR